MFELQMRVMDTSLGQKWWEDKLFRLRESIAMQRKVLTLPLIVNCTQIAQGTLLHQLTQVMHELTKTDPPPGPRELKETLKAADEPKEAPAATDVTSASAKPEGRKVRLQGFYSDAVRERQRKVEAYKKLHRIDEIGKASFQSKGPSQPAHRTSSSTVTTLQPS